MSAIPLTPISPAQPRFTEDAETGVSRPSKGAAGQTKHKA
jgi:hypothetical protein